MLKKCTLWNNTLVNCYVRILLFSFSLKNEDVLPLIYFLGFKTKEKKENVLDFIKM